MGTILLHYTFTQSRPQSLNPKPYTRDFRVPNNSAQIQFFSTRPNSSSKAQWDSNAHAKGNDRGFPFDADFEFADEDDYRFRRKNGDRDRNWWSDDYDSDDDDDDDSDDDDLGLWGELSVLDWIFKVARAFGWMVPAILISALLGTGPNSLIMALVLPLGQTALSLLMDKLWAGPSYDPEPLPRRRKKRQGRTANRTKSSGEAQDEKSMTGQQRSGYQSWASENYRSVGKEDKSGNKFGGWDELDKQTGFANFAHRRRQSNTAYARRSEQAHGKLSRRRKKDEPLLLRLLFATFPLLGSWTRLFL